MCAGASRTQKRVLKSLQLELQAVVNHLMCVLGTKLQSSERVASILSLWAMFPAPDLHFELNLGGYPVWQAWECLNSSSEPFLSLNPKQGTLPGSCNEATTFSSDTTSPDKIKHVDSSMLEKASSVDTVEKATFPFSSSRIHLESFNFSKE